VTFTCGEDGAWHGAIPRCAPPRCSDLTDESACESFSCRWLRPGCGENPLQAAGCFDLEPCEGDSCAVVGASCVVVDIDPECGKCDACGVSTSVCMFEDAMPEGLRE
jgi:hypothetical protein